MNTLDRETLKSTWVKKINLQTDEWPRNIIVRHELSFVKERMCYELVNDIFMPLNAPEFLIPSLAPYYKFFVKFGDVRKKISGEINRITADIGFSRYVQTTIIGDYISFQEAVEKSKEIDQVVATGALSFFSNSIANIAVPMQGIDISGHNVYACSFFVTHKNDMYLLSLHYLPASDDAKHGFAHTKHQLLKSEACVLTSTKLYDKEYFLIATSRKIDKSEDKNVIIQDSKQELDSFLKQAQENYTRALQQLAIQPMHIKNPGITYRGKAVTSSFDVFIDYDETEDVWKTTVANLFIPAYVTEYNKFSNYIYSARGLSWHVKFMYKVKKEGVDYVRIDYRSSAFRTIDEMKGAFERDLDNLTAIVQSIIDDIMYKKDMDK